MCGFVSFHWKELSANKSIDLAEVGKAMNHAIQHRGPDQNHWFLDKKNQMFLGHQRLKVIDLSEQSSQPMHYDQLTLSYNGEIYNYRELRNTLERVGYTFTTQGDTEVLLKLLHYYDIKALDLIRGIFSFALYNHKRQEIFVARDHLGIKPAYYINRASCFAVASECKVFNHLPEVQLSIDVEKLPEYFAYRFIQAPDTMYKDVFSLPPAHYLKYDMTSGKIKVRKYWDIPLCSDFSTLHPEEAADHFSALFSDVVNEQTVADVPLGFLLSGGIDSALLARHLSNLKTSKFIYPMAYSVDFSDKNMSERRFVDEVVKKHDITLFSYVFDEEDVVNRALPQSNYHLDEPVSQPHTPYFYLLSEQVKKNLTVVLSGEGADEVFAGYARYAYFSKDNETLNADARILNATRFLDDASIAALIGMDVVDVNRLATSKRRNMLKEYEGFQPLSRAQLIDLKAYLPSLLNRLDKTTMAFGVEARVPFLDKRLVEWGVNLPTQVKVQSSHHSSTKYFLKQMMAKHYGSDFAFRRKVGFHAPFRTWLKDSKEMKAVLFSEDFNLGLNEMVIQKAHEAFLKNPLDYQSSDIVWTVYNLKAFVQSHC